MTLNNPRISLSQMDQVRKRARANCLRLGQAAGAQGAHFGPALSLIEILTVLYGSVLNVSPPTIFDAKRDRLILSKGHGSLALYTVLAEYGFIPHDTLQTFESQGGRLPGQPIQNLELGIEYSSGSLGMGLSYGIGVALSNRLNSRDNRVFVIMGDGETNEGSVWEAAMSAAHFSLDSLCVVVDVNDMQSDGRTSDVLAMNHFEMWAGFGWTPKWVDGHDLGALTSVFSEIRTDKPTVILARTTKGRGVSFMEDNLDWHHGRLSSEQLDLALSEVVGDSERGK
jgi:transketolase